MALRRRKANKRMGEERTAWNLVWEDDINTGALTAPLHWRVPTRAVVCEDLFARHVPDVFIAEALAVMAVTGVPESHGGYGPCYRSSPPWYAKPDMGPHTFMIPTENYDRAIDLFADTAFDGFRDRVAWASMRYASDRRDAGYLRRLLQTHAAWGRFEPRYTRPEHPYGNWQWPLPNTWIYPE